MFTVTPLARVKPWRMKTVPLVVNVVPPRVAPSSMPLLLASV